jgi:hypothetical protein
MSRVSVHANEMPEEQLDSTWEHAVARLLAHHYGDGGVYIPRHNSGSEALQVAVASGFVSDDGFITRKGRTLLARSDI